MKIYNNKNFNIISNINKKNIFNILMVLMILTLITILSGCKNTEVRNTNDNNDTDQVIDEKIKITTTLFPLYDFAKHVVGDKGEVSLLLAPGTESHTFEPSPSDIRNINNSDIFIYTGKNMESWADVILKATNNQALKIIDASQNVELIKSHDAEDDEHEEDNHEEHNHGEYDPHIWTDPNNAIIIVNDILNVLCEIDNENTQYYKSNANSYINELENIDLEFKQVMANAKRNEIIFGSRFALTYLAHRYNINCYAAFDNCQAESEPSAKVMSELINKVKEDNIPVVYYEELTIPKVANLIAQETGAKTLLFHSCHNISKDEFLKGVTYIDLMKQNIENLKEGVN